MPISLLPLILVNAIPLLGALFLNWNTSEVILIYWLENAIVGFFNILKLIQAQGPASQNLGAEVNGQTVAATKLILVPFFIVHYGIFFTVHGIFILFFFLLGRSIDLVYVLITVSMLAVSHGSSYIFNYLGHKEYLRISPAEQMFAPYKRVVVIHLTILFGGMLVMFTGNNNYALAILVIIKTIIDARVHLSEHAQLQPTVQASQNVAVA